MTDSGSLTPRGLTANKGEPAAAFRTRPHNHPQQSTACSERVEICRAASGRLMNSVRVKCSYEHHLISRALVFNQVWVFFLL